MLSPYTICLHLLQRALLLRPDVVLPSQHCAETVLSAEVEQDPKIMFVATRATYQEGSKKIQEEILKSLQRFFCRYIRMSCMS